VADFKTEFKRPADAFRFAFGGVNTRDAPDAMSPNKYAIAQNVRSTGSNSIRTRPGYVPLFTAGNNSVTDIAGYATLNTDALPRFLARDAAGGIWLDNNNSVGNMNGNAGFGASMLPFRPSESPQSWMYIGAQGDYQKFSAPDANNNAVTQYKAGIAEPQNQVEAGPMPISYTAFGYGTFVPAGNNSSGVTTGNRSVDVALASIADPASATRFYVRVGNNVNATYSAGQLINEGGAPIVMDVLPPFPSGVTALSVFYQSGNTGNCVMVPQISPLTGNSSFVGSLRRGSLLLVGSEVILVQGTIYGPGGFFGFTTSTNNSFSAGATISGVTAIGVDGNLSGAITSSFSQCNLNAGITTLSQVFTGTPPNPFNTVLPPTASFSNGTFPQLDDYVHLSVAFNDPSQLNELLVIFNLNGNANNYNGDLMYYAVRPGDLSSITSGGQTVLGAILQSAESEIIGNLPTPGNISPPAQSNAGNNQWGEIWFPISALTRIGGDESKSLVNATAVRLQVDVANNCTFQWSSLWVGGGGTPDVGNNGAPYQYQCVPLSSVTGTRGNPTPVMRYGVNPRRQPITVKTSALNSSYDPQIDTWEIFRYGGSITSYRFIGSVPTGSDFKDNVFDDAAAAGSPLVIDNTEPWPSIDVPWKQTSGVTAFGPFLQVAGVALPASMNRWLPGTIFQVGGQEAFTLRSRPIVSGNNATFEFQECIGSGAQSSVFVLEPNVARQPLPYLWGPNEYGYFFGCGDPLRPGVVQWCKANNPDAVPTGYTRDLCPPSEPLMGGEALRGISLVASSMRWWALYFQQGGTPLYTQVEVAVGKRLAAPFGKCTDGEKLYFWATDCIAATAGGEAKSLTDEDLYNLFPHGGLNGKNVTRGSVTYYAPDYSRAATFRMAVREGIIYAPYQDSTGTPRMLIGQIRGDSVAWSQDTYAASMTAVYAIEQPKGTLTTSASLYPAVVMGSNNGHVWKLQDFTNDGGNANGANISGILGTFEWDGGDLRANQLWGDQFLDVRAPFGMTVTPVSQSNSVAANTSIAANANRQFVPVSMNGGQLLNFVGLQLAWTDNFNNSNNATVLHAWQPSFVEKPETIQDRFGDWYDFGQASYVRGFVLHADTNGNNKNISIRNSDTNNLVTFAGGPANNQINHNGEQELAYYFNPPFVAHMIRDEPQDQVQWRKFGIDWFKDPWPELTKLSSPWMNLGQDGSKYLRGAVIPMDTNGANVSLTFVSSDGGNATVGPFNTTAAEKTAVGWAFTTPLIGHDFQLVPSNNVRIWYEEIRWDCEVWPELIPEASAWFNMGTPGAKYLRGAVIPMDTGGNNVNINFISSDGGNVALPANTAANVKTPVAFAFSVPLIGHEFQLVPSANNSVRIWWEEVQWIYDKWPEFTKEASPWMELGTQGAKYLRGCVIPLDTGNNAVSLTFVSSDGGNNITVGPFTTPVSEKTAVPFAFSIPLIGHDFQLIPSNNVRVWYPEIRWDFDPWPELINEATGWLPVLQGGGAAFLQGLVLPIETNASTPALSLLTDTGLTIALVATVTPLANVKTGVAYSLATPVVCHQVQILPTSPCRVWLNEIQWFAEATSELASTWTTQWTALGGKGYKTIPRIEPSYSSTAAVALVVSSFDGKSPQTLTLPATSGVTEKILLTLTFNKGTLYRFSATSAATFQIFQEDSAVYVYDWGRGGEARLYNLLGAPFGDKARI